MSSTRIPPARLGSSRTFGGVEEGVLGNVGEMITMTPTPEIEEEVMNARIGSMMEIDGITMPEFGLMGNDQRARASWEQQRMYKTWWWRLRSALPSNFKAEFKTAKLEVGLNLPSLRLSQV
jgi:hypothetical protein